MGVCFAGYGASTLFGSPLEPKAFQSGWKLWDDGWVGQNYDILLELQESLLPIVKNTLIVLTVLFILLLAIYLVSIYVHTRRKRYIARKMAQWQSMIHELAYGERSLGDFNIPGKDKKYFRDILIAEFFKQDVSGKNRIRDLYRQLGFLNDDIQQLKSRLWWNKIRAVERLGDLELAEAEEYVFPLLANKKSEVRFSALKMLASRGSKKLIGILPKIFADESRWAYRYLVNTLFLAEIPADNLKPLASSRNRGLRKAAAILLGRKENKEAVPLLQNLANDGVKDIRREAIRSLGRISLVEAMPILSDKISDAEPQVRTEVARALGELKDLNTLLLLDRLADDPDFEVRLQAFFALARFGKPGEDVIRKYEVKHPEIAREFLAKSKNGNHN